MNVPRNYLTFSPSPVYNKEKRSFAAKLLEPELCLTKVIPPRSALRLSLRINSKTKLLNYLLHCRNVKFDKRFAKANGGERKLGSLNGMWERHHAIAKRVALGQTNKEIAAALGCTPQTVSNVRNDPMVKTVIDKLVLQSEVAAVDVATQIRELAPKALEVAKTLMESTDVSATVRSGLARDLLDRAGYAAPKQLQVVSTQLTSSDIEELKNRARGSGVVSNVSNNDEIIDL